VRKVLPFLGRLLLLYLIKHAPKRSTRYKTGAKALKIPVLEVDRVENQEPSAINSTCLFIYVFPPDCVGGNLTSGSPTEVRLKVGVIAQLVERLLRMQKV
jgi:hypothetical protein